MNGLSGLGSVLQGEPVAVWATLLNALATAVIVFAPRFGVNLSQPEQAVVYLVANAIVALIVRSQVTPTAQLGIRPPS